MMGETETSRPTLALQSPIPSLFSSTLRLCLILASFLAVAQRPNIILIMVDDMGFPSACACENSIRDLT